MPEEAEWPPYKVKQSMNRLKQLHDMVLKRQNERINDDPILDELYKLQVVRCSGHLETVFSNCFLSFIRRHSSNVVADYIDGTFRKWQSPKPDVIKGVLKKASVDLEQLLTKFLSQEEGLYSSDLGALVSERDKISHGDNDRVTRSSSQRYYEATIAFSDWFTDSFKPGGDADSVVSGNSDDTVAELPVSPGKIINT